MPGNVLIVTVGEFRTPVSPVPEYGFWATDDTHDDCQFPYLTPAEFYYHFPTPQALWAAVLARPAFQAIRVQRDPQGALLMDSSTDCPVPEDELHNWTGFHLEGFDPENARQEPPRTVTWPAVTDRSLLHARVAALADTLYHGRHAIAKPQNVTRRDMAMEIIARERISLIFDDPERCQARRDNIRVVGSDPLQAALTVFLIMYNRYPA